MCNIPLGVIPLVGVGGVQPDIRYQLFWGNSACLRRAIILARDLVITTSFESCGSLNLLRNPEFKRLLRFKYSGVNYVLGTSPNQQI